MDAANQGKLELIAKKTLQTYDQLYVVIDFLNKTLKDQSLMFGLTKDSANNTMTISIYKV